MIANAALITAVKTPETLSGWRHHHYQKKAESPGTPRAAFSADATPAEADPHLRRPRRAGGDSGVLLSIVTRLGVAHEKRAVGEPIRLVREQETKCHPSDESVIFVLNSS